MIITPRVFVVAIATGLYWLLALLTALFLVAGIVRPSAGFIGIGLSGLAFCLIVRSLYSRNKDALKRWVRHQS